MKKVHSRFLPGYVAGLLVLGLLSAAPARAQLTGGELVLSMSILGYMGSTAGEEAVFLGAQIGWAAEGRVMPPNWSVPELVVGIRSMVLGGVFLAMSQDQSPSLQDQDTWLGVGLACTAAGAWLIGHAIASLVGYHSGSEGPPEVVPQIGPCDGGATVGVRALF